MQQYYNFYPFMRATLPWRVVGRMGEASFLANRECATVLRAEIDSTANLKLVMKPMCMFYRVCRLQSLHHWCGHVSLNIACLSHDFYLAPGGLRYALESRY